MADVRDILEIHQEKVVTNKSKKNRIKRLIEPVKRPQGVNREVWGLISKDDSAQPPLIPAEEPKLYKHPKAKLRHGVRKWHCVPFTNPARNDGAKFSHWRCVNDDPNKEYPFAKYNKQINLSKYTNIEYEQYLKDEAWTREETDYLFELCKTYDLRFFIIHDRWDLSRFENAKTRSIDELKDRYYKVTGILQKLKTGVDDSQAYVFDLEHEQKRREQLEKLFKRTKEQVDEELYLIEELKKIEIRKKEREKKQQEVSKLLAVDLENSSTKLNTANQNNLLKNRGVNPLGQQPNGASNLSNKRLNKQRKHSELSSSGGGNRSNSMSNNRMNASLNHSGTSSGGAVSGVANTSGNSLNNSGDTSNLNQSFSPTSFANQSMDKNKKSLIFKAVVESTGIKFPDNKQAGVSLRSYKMKLPQSVGLRKLKAIEQLLEELQVESKPIATENICEQFNELRSDIVLLYELQQALSSSEYELQTLRHRYESVLESKNIDLSTFEIPPSTSSLVNTLQQSAITPQKRNLEILDTSLTPSGPLERRRKAAINQTNFIKRLRGRNAT